MKIENKQAYYEAMAEIESFLQKGIDNLTEAEDERLDLLSVAVEAWEIKAYPMPVKPDFKAIVLYIMQAKSYNQTQLANELHISPGFMSDMIRGKKDPNLEVLKTLHTRFQIDGNLLLDSL